jgi:hypothetical protein
MEHLERTAIELLQAAPRNSTVLNEWCDAIANDPSHGTLLLSGFVGDFPPVDTEATGEEASVARAEQEARYVLARAIVEYRLTVPGDEDGRNRDDDLLTAIKHYHLAIVQAYQRYLSGHGQ